MMAEIRSVDKERRLKITELIAGGGASVAAVLAHVLNGYTNCHSNRKASVSPTTK